MKKFIGALIVICLVIAGIFFLAENKKNDNVIPPDIGVQQSENNNETQKEEEKTPEKETEGETQEKEDNKNEKSGIGMFLGQTDSNFIVIFSGTENKDVQMKIGKGIDINNIELGAPVDYRYTVSETDEKTLTYIKTRD